MCFGIPLATLRRAHIHKNYTSPVDINRQQFDISPFPCVYRGAGCASRCVIPRRLCNAPAEVGYNASFVIIDTLQCFSSSRDIRKSDHDQNCCRCIPHMYTRTRIDQCVMAHWCLTMSKTLLPAQLNPWRWSAPAHHIVMFDAGSRSGS